jgi:ParB family chromosome partitioning protein
MENEVVNTFKIIDIPIDNLYLEVIDRTEIELRDVSALAENIKSVGLLTPIVVQPHGQKFRVIAGKRRVSAVQKLGWSEIPAVVRGDKTGNFSLQTLADNLFNRPVSEIMQARIFRSLLDKGEFKTEREISAAFGISASLISRRLQLLELPEELQARIESGAAPLGIVEEKIERDATDIDEAVKKFNNKKYVAIPHEFYLNSEHKALGKKDFTIKTNKTHIEISLRVPIKKIKEYGTKKCLNGFINKRFEEIKDQEFMDNIDAFIIHKFGE